MAYNRWINYSDELYHHGVKGMKWGVRKDRIPTHKRTYTTFGANRQDKTLGERHRIPKGTKIYRTTTSMDENGSGSTYVSYQTADRLYYKAWVTYNARRDGKDVYEKTYKLKEDLLIPSIDEVRKAYSDAVTKIGKKSVDYALEKFLIGDRVVGNDIAQAKKDWKLYKAMTKATEDGQVVLTGSNQETGEEVITQFKTGKNGQIVTGKDGKPVPVRSMTGKQAANAEVYSSGATMYHRLLELNKDKTLSDYAIGMGTITKNPKVKEEMVKTLKAKGYNAIVDEAGVGSISTNGKTANREGQETLILFDRDKSLAEVKTEKIGDNYNLYYDRNVASDKLRRMRAREAI